MIGWPIALMALLGLSMMLSVRSALNWYLITMLIGFLTGTIFLPLVVVYSPAYIFLALPILIIAGLSIGRIFKDLRVSSLVVAVTFVIICSLFNLPGVVSSVQDGARYNFRSAVRLVQKNWHEGDRVAGFSMGTFRYYAKECCGQPRNSFKSKSSRPIRRSNKVTRTVMDCSSIRKKWTSRRLATMAQY